ncbi:MAG: NAD-binding protein [Syntrophobacterales bacterium]|nr:NAD-binding protein [Syntrophobacterales bacterium]
MAIIKTFFTQPQSPVSNIFIIGAGAFGRKALERLSKKYPESVITVVDNSKETLDLLFDNITSHFRIKTLHGDGIEILTWHDADPDLWIIPAIPIHVAREWLNRKLSYKGIIIESTPLPKEMLEKLPNPFRISGREDIVFVSIADFICPDNCPEPLEKCTHTGKPRPGNLFDMIASAVPNPWSALVFRSFQLAPGVGGYPLSYLVEGMKTMEELYSSKEAKNGVIIATACRCHGVINAIKLR